MSKKITLKVRKAAGAKVETFPFEKPTSLQDPVWDNMVSDRESDLNELAWQQWRIKWQGAFRQSGTAPEAYRYGGGASATVVKVPAGEFSPEQIEILRKQGAVVVEVEQA